VAVLRDYCLRDEDNGDNATIVEAALATSAAPTFFKPVTIDVRQYVDGGLLANNPVNKVLVEAQNIWCPNRGIGEIEAMVKCFVSIGTGNPGLDTIKKGAKPFLIKTLKNIATETERTAEDFAKQHRGLLDEERYFRYNVEQGLQGVGLAEYREQAKIEAATYAYLSNQEQKFSIRNSAKNLKIKQCGLKYHLSSSRADNGLFLLVSTPLTFNKIIVRDPSLSTHMMTKNKMFDTDTC
jgi:predicted acylesterase/phospholipase RssA